MLFEKSIEAYSITTSNEITYIDDIMSSLDFESATNEETKSQLEHSLLLTRYLSEVIPKIKIKYG